MPKARQILFMALVITIATSVNAQKKYTDGNRPYEFGFKIDGEQHRQEKKDENGIIMGEFGYITGDGIYHVTVFATDENGNYKVLSMKHIRVGPSPWGPSKAKTPAPQAAPPPPPPPLVQSGPTSRPPLLGKPGCSGCLIPTPPPPVKRPPPGSPSNSPGSSPPFGTNQPGKFPGTPGFPGTGQNPSGGKFPATSGGPGSSQAPFGGKYPATSGAPGSGANSPGGKFPPSSSFPASGQNPLGGKFPSSPGSSSGPGKTPGSPGSSSGGPGQFPPGGSRPNNPAGGSRPNNPPGGSTSGAGGQRPGAGSAGQRPVDGLPPGLTMDDVTGLLYKFNYTVGFHGHNEQGYKNGDKEGEYNANYRDGLGTIVTYVANENGYQPKVKFVKLSKEETPRAETEKEYGLKGYEFKWFNRR